MAGNDVTHRRDQRVDVPRSGQLGGERDVVDRARPVDAVGEPAAQLRRRQRQWLVVGGRDELGPRLRPPTGPQLVDPLRQQSHGAEFEDVADTQLDPAFRSDRGGQLGGYQRMTAEIKERVVHTDPRVTK